MVRSSLTPPISALLVVEKSSFTRSKLRFFSSSRLDLGGVRLLLKILALFTLTLFTARCGIWDFFSKKTDSIDADGEEQEVLGLSLGSKAGAQNDEALRQVYEVTTTMPPAAVRPDPDTFPRLILRQFHEEGSTMARTIGRIERFRSLHGGASVDFATVPAESYDATSVLATMKIAEQLCQSLVSPKSWQEVGWTTILPGSAGEVERNLRFIAQRLTGRAERKITDDQIAQLKTIYDSNKKELTGFDPYIAPCTAVFIDAHAMLF